MRYAMKLEELEQIKAGRADAVNGKRVKYPGQIRLALRNVDVVDPNSIEDYIATDGYFALYKAVTSMKSAEIIKTISDSGLRGRGGAGFPTGMKWQLVLDSVNEQKYVVCNADEGDPGAFMDRAILEGDPHSVLEAMTIAGFTVGANRGFIYVRAEYPVAVKNLKIAIEQSRARGLLGQNIFGTEFCFDIELRLGAGAFVCGEETALLASVEGRRGEPTQKPPFPASSGLYKKPTLINNVETYSVIPMIILKGASYFNTIGTEKSKGTKVFALAGKITNGGLVEVPMGTTLKTLIYDIGGGAPSTFVGPNKVELKHSVKAVQIGGPSGGCIPESLFDVGLDYESVKQYGAILGSGGLVVMDDKTCMVNIAKFFIKFCVDESCGKCTPCRIGNRKLLNILEKITSGKGEESDITELENLGKVIIDTSLCGLGQSSPNPVLTTIRFFRDEYIAHINGKCPAGECFKNTKRAKYFIDEKCIHCGKCEPVCPVNAIHDGGEKFFINDKCISCGRCEPVCPVNAIHKESAV